MAWFTQLSFALAVAAVIGSQTVGSAAELKVGDEAPAFELQGKESGCCRLVPEGLHSRLHEGMQVDA